MLESANYGRQRSSWWAFDKQVDVVALSIHFDEPVLVVRADAWKQSAEIFQTGRRKHLTPKLSHEDDVVNEFVDTVATCAKIRVPDSFAPVLDILLGRIRKDCL